MTLKGGCSDAVRDINTVAYLRRGYTTLLLILARDINTVAYLHAGDIHNTVAYPPRRGYINTVAYLAVLSAPPVDLFGPGLRSGTKGWLAIFAGL